MRHRITAIRIATLHTPLVLSAFACTPSPMLEANDASGVQAVEHASREPKLSPAVAQPLTRGQALTPDDRDLETIAALRYAQTQYRQFLQRAGSDPDYQEAVLRARERVADLEATIGFLEQGIAQRRLEANSRRPENR